MTPPEPNWDELRTNNQLLHQKKADDYESVSNQIFFDITKQFILINTFLLTFTSPVFINIDQINELSKAFLFVGWALLLISIIAGLIQLFIDHNYFSDMSKLYYIVAGVFSRTESSRKGLDQAFEQKDIEQQKNFKNKSSEHAFSIEIFSFIVGLVFILITFYQIMF